MTPTEIEAGDERRGRDMEIAAWLRARAAEANATGLHENYIAADAFTEAADAIESGEALTPTPPTGAE